MLPTAASLSSLDADGAGLTDLAAFPTVRPVTVRYEDLGGDGAVTAVALARWIEDSRVRADRPRYRRLVADGGIAPVRTLLAAQRISLRAPLPRTAEYRIGVGVRRVGRTSFSYGHGVFAGDECVAVADSVGVVATASGPLAIPDALRADLADLALDEPGGAPARPEDARRSRVAYTERHPVRSRITDVDTNRHVNNVALLGWYADAVSAWQTAPSPAEGGPPEELAPTAWEVQYVHEVAHPRAYDVLLATDAVPGGRHYRLGLFAGERCVGLADGFGAPCPGLPG